MSVIKQSMGARTALTVTGFSNLASGAYVTSDAPYNCNTNQPLDVILEVSASTGTIAGNKQIVVFIQESLDGTTYRTGPNTGTNATDESNLKFVGILPINTAASLQRGTFSIASVLGYVPFAFKVVLKNDVGAVLTAGTVFTAETINTVV